MIQCCPLQSGDDGTYEVTVIKKPRARVVHHCGECSDEIAVKQQYEEYRGLYDGKWYKHKTCLSCVEIRDHFACSSGWMFGEVWNDLEENFFPDMKAGGPCLEGLSPSAKDRLFTKRTAWLLAQDDEE